MAKSWFKIAKARGANAGDILIYSDIGAGNATAQDFHAELQGLGKVDTLNIRISSDGGDVFHGFAIYNMLMRHAAHKVVTVDGLAASMASVITMAGDEVVMPSNAMLMIHNPWGGVVGSADEIKSFGDALDKMGAGILDAYRTRTGIAPKELQAMMDQETWLSAKEAVSMGFADRIEKPVAMAAGAFNLDRFNHVPDSFGRSITQGRRVAMKSKTNARAEAEAEEALEIDTPEAQSPADIRKAILAQHAEIRSLCKLAGKPELAEGFIGEDKSPADVLKALDTAREEDAKSGKGKRPAAGARGGDEVSARHNPGASDAAAAKSIDPADVYARWNSAGRNRAA